MNCTYPQCPRPGREHTSNYFPYLCLAHRFKCWKSSNDVDLLVGVVVAVVTFVAVCLVLWEIML